MLLVLCINRGYDRILGHTPHETFSITEIQGRSGVWRLLRNIITMWFQAMNTKNVCLFLGSPLAFWFMWRVIVICGKLKQLEDPYRAFLARQQPNSGLCKRPKHPWPWPFIYDWILCIVQWPKIIALRSMLIPIVLALSSQPILKIS